MKLGQKENKMSPEERCGLEIAGIEDQLLASHPDVQGLCLALRDWNEELRLIQLGQERDGNEP